MLFEAKLLLSDRYVVVDHNVMKDLPHTYLVYMLGSIIARSSHSCCWDVQIYDHRDTIQMFERGIGIKKVESKLIILRLSIAKDFQRLSKLCGTVHHLHLMNESVNYMITPFRDVHFQNKHLMLSSFVFDSTESRNIELLIKSTPSLTCLTLDCCSFYFTETDVPDILPGVEACNNIENLCINITNDDTCSGRCSWERTFPHIIRESKSLEEFYIICEMDVLSKLTDDYLCTNTSIRKLIIHSNNDMMFQCGCKNGYCDEEEICVCDDEWEEYKSRWQIYTTKFAKMIKENKTLTELTMKVPDSACIIAEAMCENNTLQKLTIHDDTNYKKSAVEVFSTMLRENTTLKEFCLKPHHIHFSDEEMIRVFDILFSSLSQNTTLSKMQLIYTRRLPPKCREAIKCANDNRLIIV